MAEKPIKNGTRVEVVGKGVIGTVAYIGTTLFSSGKWIGVVLDEAKGKNNGVVQGKTYFTCEDNHGIFVRQSQIAVLDNDNTQASGDTSVKQTPSTPAPLKTTVTASTPATPSTTATPSEIKSSIPRKSGLRPPSYHGKSSENLAEAAGVPTATSTPAQKRAGSAPKDIPLNTTISVAPKETPKEKPTSRLPKSKETTPVDDRRTSISAMKQKLTPSPGDSDTSQTTSSFPSSQLSTPDIMSKSFTLGEKVMNLQQQQEIEGLRAEIKDLNEKLETLRFKRGEDKAKLKEYEKAKIQLQQLQEYKTRMQETHVDLQRQLQNSKKENKDVLESFERYKEEMADVAETVEIATLDKEMAEEKCESLQQEVEQLRDRVEELNVDLEIIKDEIKDKGSDGVATDYQVKQLEQQNERLKEALVKMRDLSNQEKSESQKLQKQLEKLSNENSNLQKAKQRYQKDGEELQEQIIELKEQVDAALGAEEMVETLTERNLQIEERMQELEEEKLDLEQLNEMNEELQENAKETELELREELDMAHARALEAFRKLEAMQESVSDYENTISKFRDLVAKLQETNRELRSKQVESEQKESPVMEMFDIKTKIAETKAYAKTIEMELRKMEALQANVHVQLMQSFMPDSFLSRGGDHDAVLVMMMVPRILNKADILIRQVKDKFGSTDKIEREHVLKTHAADQFSFANQMTLLLNILQGIMRLYDNALNTCGEDLFLKVGTLLPEMAAHEKSVDYFIDLLRKDQLDETIALDLLEKSINFFHQLHFVHLANEKLDCTTYMADQDKVILTACECLATDIGRLKILLTPGQEQSEISILLRDIEMSNNETRTCARKIKRRLPQAEGALTLTPLSFGKEIQDLLVDCGKHMEKLSKTMHLVASGSMQQAALLTDQEGVMSKKMEEIAYQATDKVYGKEDSGPYECLRNSFSTVVKTMSQLASAMENGEYDFDGTPEKKPTAPVVLRANYVKAQIADIESMKSKLDVKEEESRDLKRQLKMKQEEISEQQVRLGLVEKKLENSVKDGNERVEKLQRKLDEINVILHKKEKEYEETMDVLQGDIDALEQEKNDLKERLKVMSKRSLLEGLTRQSGQSGLSPSVSATGLSLSTSLLMQDSPVIIRQIESLKEALKIVKRENIRLKSDKMKNQLASLPPLFVPNKPASVSTTTGFVKLGELPETVPGREKLTTLAKNTALLLKEVNKLSACPKVVDITKRKAGTEPVSDSMNPASQLVSSTAYLTQLETKTQEVEVTNLLAANRTGGQVRTDFSTFPTPEFARVLRENSRDCVRLGRVTVPVPGGKGEIIPVNVQPEQLKTIHLSFLN